MRPATSLGRFGWTLSRARLAGALRVGLVILGMGLSGPALAQGPDASAQDGGPAGDSPRAVPAGAAAGSADAGSASPPDGALQPARPEPAVTPPPAPDAAVGAVNQRPRQAVLPEKRTIPSEDRPEVVVGVILGLLALMALAYLGGHQRVLTLEQRLGISQVITAGLPFIVLGMFARLPAVGLLTDPILSEISPLLRVGLGSVGFVAGFRFDVRLFNGLPSRSASIAMLSTLTPALTVAAATAPLLLGFSRTGWSLGVHDPVFVRDALILATAGAMTARSAIPVQEKIGRDGVAARILRLEELAGVVGLALIAAFFRPSDFEGDWQLPGAIWLLVTLGLGTALGLLFYGILLATPQGPDFLAVTLGAIAFAAGTAGYLHLSSVAVAFVAGVILANFPGTFQPPLRDMLNRIERPIYLLALFVIGALWNVSDWRGWVLMPVFMAARLAGKWLASVIAARSQTLPITAQESRALAISPIGALAIAIVVNAQLLYPGGSISLVVSAVIGGGVLTEAFVQLAGRRARRSVKPPANGANGADDTHVEASGAHPTREPPR